MSAATFHHAPPDERPRVPVGMLGYGFMGRAHTNALRTMPYIFWPGGAVPELESICGRTEQAVAEAATRYGFSRYTTDWRALVTDPEIAVFDNVAADDMHVEPTLAAIEVGKHVICEKPLAGDVADAERMFDAAQRAGVKHLTCFNYRFMPAVALARELVAGGELGELHQVRFRYSQEWRTNPAAELPSSAGVLSIIGCHAVDQARFLVGEIASVIAAIGSPVTTPQRQFGGRPVDQDDTISMLVQFQDGLTGTIDASLVSPGRRNLLAWELNGSRGSLAWSLEKLNELQVFRAGTGPTQGMTEVIVCESDHALAAPWWPSGHILGWEHGHANMLAHFFAAIAEDRSVGPQAATFADGLQAARVAAAARESAHQGGWQKVPAAELTAV